MVWILVCWLVADRVYVYLSLIVVRSYTRSNVTRDTCMDSPTAKGILVLKWATYEADFLTFLRLQKLGGKTGFSSLFANLSVG
jgi:hypothetical protein